MELDDFVVPHRAFTRRLSGLGLGLFIARKAVRAHGGDIYIRNIAGKGCAFSIKIPSAVEAAPV